MGGYIQKMKRGHTDTQVALQGLLEVGLFAHLEKFNVFVYENGEQEKYSLIEAVEVGHEYPDVLLLKTFNRVTGWFEYSSIMPKYTGLRYREFKRMMDELQKLSCKDLKQVYRNVSRDIQDRNGYVVEFNQLLLTLMGCNTNSSFLGSVHQSEGALFYIGPYISKVSKHRLDAIFYYIFLA